MSDDKKIVATVYGHGNKIDKISISLFNDLYQGETDANIYCNTINSLELKDNEWLYAKPLSANTPYTLDFFLPFTFSKIIMKFDYRSFLKIMREVSKKDLAKALKIERDNVKAKVFGYMTKRASQMLKDDMESMGWVGFKESLEAQEKIISVINDLIDRAELVLPYQDESD